MKPFLLLLTIFCLFYLSCSKQEEPNIVEEIPAKAEVVKAEDLTGTFTLKSAPPNLDVFLDNELIHPISNISNNSLSPANGLRNYEINKGGTLSFRAPGYKTIECHSSKLPVKKGIAGIKLEIENPILQLKGEYGTGIQPKSAYFSPDGQRLFVPLLGQHGVDVFKQAEGLLKFEKRLTVPNSNSAAFVEAMCDPTRRELWVSNMIENNIYIFDLDTLEYKTSLNTGGKFPKVIVQSPDRNITVVSNWITKDLSVFDSDTKILIRKIPVEGTPRGMAFSPDGSLLYTAIYDEPLVVVVDMAKKAIVSRFRLYEGEGAARHVIYRDEKLYVSDMYRGTVNILNASTGALLRSRRIASNINTIVLSPDGQYIFASSRGKNHPENYTMPGPDFGAIYMLNAKDLTLLERVWGRNQPTGLSISPDGKLLVFTDFLDANLELYSITTPLPPKAEQ